MPNAACTAATDLPITVALPDQVASPAV